MRAAWARLAGRQTCVVHDNASNPGNVRLTADRVVLIDWDESHVDVPDLDLDLLTTLRVLTRPRMTSPRRRRPHGKRPSVGMTGTQPRGSPKFGRSAYRQRRAPSAVSRLPLAARRISASCSDASAIHLKRKLGRLVGDLREHSRRPLLGRRSLTRKVFRGYFRAAARSARCRGRTAGAAWATRVRVQSAQYGTQDL